jgi:hypothetical protein
MLALALAETRERAIKKCALLQYNSLDYFGSGDFSDSPTVQRAAPDESRILVISFQISCPES